MSYTKKNIGKNPWVKWMYMYNCYSSVKTILHGQGFSVHPAPQ